MRGIGIIDVWTHSFVIKMELMKKITSIFAVFVLSFSIFTGAIDPVNAQEDLVLTAVDSGDTTGYLYSMAATNKIEDRCPYILPTYFIYGDGFLDKQGAEDLLEEMDIVDHIKKYTTKVYVINPKNNKTFTDEDLDSFISIVKSSGIVSNIKVIGVGDGATFVNNYISQRCYAVAGIMTYGGEMASGLDYDVPVPTYISQSNQDVAEYFIKANGASLEKESDGLKYYANSDKPLQKVVVNNENETMEEAFSNAWTTVFSSNYRYYNYEEEWYTVDVSLITEPYELVEYVMYDELGITVNTKTEDITGNGESLWSEYIPDAALDADDGTVPLVLLLHGNGNDNRVQPETSGWIELASEEGFICVAAEHQGSSGYTPLATQTGNGIYDVEMGGVIKLINKLLEDYPQLDSSRIYTTGLSLGANYSYNLGILYPDIFAAVSGHSGTFGNPDLLEIAQNEAIDGNFVPLYMVGGLQDAYKPLPVGLEGEALENNYNYKLYQVLRAYGALNGVVVSDQPDISISPYYGTQTTKEEWTKIGEIDAYVGTLENNDRVVIKTVALNPYAHWNYKPVAREMWDFFKQYAKDQSTGETIFLNVVDNQNETSTLTQIFPYVVGFTAVGLVMAIYISRRKKV